MKYCFNIFKEDASLNDLGWSIYNRDLKIWSI